MYRHLVRGLLRKVSLMRPIHWEMASLLGTAGHQIFIQGLDPTWYNAAAFHFLMAAQCIWSSQIKAHLIKQTFGFMASGTV